MNTATQTSRTPKRHTTAEIWAALRPLMEDAWSAPIGVSIHPDMITLDVRLPDNDRAAVDYALKFLGLPAAKFDSDYVIRVAGTEWRPYGRHDRWVLPTSPLLPHIQIAVHCNFYTSADASAHWDGLLLAESVAS